MELPVGFGEPARVEGEVRRLVDAAAASATGVCVAADARRYDLHRMARMEEMEGIDQGKGGAGGRGDRSDQGEARAGRSGLLRVVVGASCVVPPCPLPPPCRTAPSRAPARPAD